MGKGKAKERKGNSNHQDDPKSRKRGIVKRDFSQHKAATKFVKKTTDSNQHKRPIIPFSKNDHVLLVGEGDFSFTMSLAKHHGVKHIVATCYDNENHLHVKYPHVNENLMGLAGRQGITLEDEVEDEEEWNGLSSPDSSSSDESFASGDFMFRDDIVQKTNATVHYGINATKLATAHRKVLLSNGPFSKIIFNFPHVGGLSTDVNRQVRSNQELLVGFFNAAKPLLASKINPVSIKSNIDDQEDDIDFDLDTGEPLSSSSSLTTGQIIVTLFEGEPYTLWNIRDLARHSSLKVVESFKFPWSAYPGYKHARTIGEISGKEKDGKRAGAWRGEEREARMYVLRVKDEDLASQASVAEAGTAGNQIALGKRKKKGEINGEESDESD